MSLQEVSFKDQYITGEDNLIEEFYIPCLSSSLFYDRAAGFFSSSIYSRIKIGLEPFIRKGGKMRLITSVRLSKEDIDLIRSGYEERQWLQEHLLTMFEEFYQRRNDFDVANLCWLIKCGRLDIRITLPDLGRVEGSEGTGIFHDKVGIFTDEKGDHVVFFGSNNESVGGWGGNFESFEVYCSWDSAVSSRAESRRRYFERLWEGELVGFNTFEFPKAFREKLIQISPEYFQYESSNTMADNLLGFEARPCQEEALQAFLRQDGVCLFQMATGTGKTKAALYSMYTVKNKWDLLLIMVPSLDLLQQWKSDVKLFFPDDYVLLCGSSNSTWKSQFLDLIQARIPCRTIVICTYNAASSNFMMSNLKYILTERFALIADEAHNMGTVSVQNFMDKIRPRLRIGLSATPDRNFDEEGTERIYDYFEHKSFEFSIKDAIREGYLVEYEYFITPVFLTNGEWEDYVRLSNDIARLRFLTASNEQENGDRSRLEQMLSQRAQILKTTDSKSEYFPKIISSIRPEQRTLIYGDSIVHLQNFATILDQLSKEYFIYVGHVDSVKVRPRMIEDFKRGIRKFLLAVKCLDEGVDIPVCDTAIFISSSTSLREFVQRRGRVLRKSIGKTRGYLYDFIVIPPYDQRDSRELELAKQVISKEYSRIVTMANDAINGTIAITNLDDFLMTQGLDPYSL
ncbi:DEAD/DEAH box helicase family protein [Tumebacillus flagellatus]|uniref:DNA repair helicase n=1 Tax=Tumebacillus flagellatus TaxID=1157490 RepID=A0A074LXA7_9BACL|nr:DEAD/DEAH box helicase family protein [Tumebacillus flagellatus]KEO84708.1 hypothetical protein EL26_04105 [Tumebacillus flagellatus]